MSTTPERLRNVDAFIRDEYPSLCRYVYSTLGNRDDTLETVQEAFLRFHEIQIKANGEVKDRALLFRLARNLTVDLIRRRKVRQAYRQDVETVMRPVRVLANPEQIASEREQRRLAEAAFEKLNERQRECLLLRNSGLSYKDIALVLGLSPESIGPTLGRAIRKFRAAYDEIVGTKNRTREVQRTG